MQKQNSQQLKNWLRIINSDTRPCRNGAAAARCAGCGWSTANTLESFDLKAIETATSDIIADGNQFRFIT